MTRVDGDTFDEEDLVRLFIAATLAEAKEVETLLTGRGVEYVVEVEPFGRTLFGSPRYGATFYVRSAQARYCGALLLSAGMEIGLLVETEPEG
jgi:hypothetical protein